MSRSRTVLRCQECGSQSPKWVGRCPACGEWNSLVEELEVAGGEPSTVPLGAPAVPIAEVDVEAGHPRSTGSRELDRVLSGGLVPGSVTLVGGEPGVGKSTLLLQVASEMAKSGGRVLYVSA
jgi:DNA repair protein RadA/Sms